MLHTRIWGIHPDTGLDTIQGIRVDEATGRAVSVFVMDGRGRGSWQTLTEEEADFVTRNYNLQHGKIFA